MPPGGIDIRRQPSIWSVFFLSIAALIAGLSVALALAGTTVGPQEVKIFVSPSASMAQVQSIHQQVLAIPGVSDCVFWSPERDYLEALLLLPKPESSLLTARTTPSSWRCRFASPVTLDEIAARVVHLPGVYEIVGPSPTVFSQDVATPLRFL